MPAHLELTIPCTPGDTGRLTGRNGRGPPAGQGIETHCQAHGVEFTGRLLLRRNDLQGAATAGEPVAPEPLAVLDQAPERTANQGQGNWPVNRLQLVEEFLDSPVVQLQPVPPLRQRLLGPAPHEVKAHLHAVQQVPAAVAEAAQFLTELLDLPVALNEPKQRTTESFLRRSFMRHWTHQVAPRFTDSGVIPGPGPR